MTERLRISAYPMRTTSLRLVHVRRRILARQWKGRKVWPCWTCCHLAEWEGMPFEQVQAGKHWSYNGYQEYMLCDDHYKPE